MNEILDATDAVPMRAIRDQGALRMTRRWGHVQISRETVMRLLERGFVSVDRDGLVKLTAHGESVLEGHGGGRGVR